MRGDFLGCWWADVLSVNNLGQSLRRWGLWVGRQAGGWEGRGEEGALSR